MPASTISALIVEDNATEARLLAAVLRGDRLTRFQVTEARDLAQALARLEEGSFDVILLDLGLPDSDGYETFLTLKPRAGRAAILVMTGLDDEQMALRAVRDGA